MMKMKEQNLEKCGKHHKQNISTATLTGKSLKNTEWKPIITDLFAAPKNTLWTLRP
jgi:hypothetical protein